KMVANLEPPQKGPLVDLTFTPDGSRLACATFARTVVVWDLDGLARRLTQLGLSTDLKPSAAPRRGQPPLTLEIRALDRLRFSQQKYVFDNGREVADLTNLIRQSPETWNFSFERARRYQRLNEFGNAIEDYRRWIQLDLAGEASRSGIDRAWPLRDLALIY